MAIPCEKIKRSLSSGDMLHGNKILAEKPWRMELARR
jgi:hypothetical protein